MGFFYKYKSPLGYTTGDNRIDSYGVDHSNFSIRDELEYQMARQKRENRLLENYKANNITTDYPAQGTDFWGDSENNYGFGFSKISDNLEDIEKRPIPDIQPDNRNKFWSNNKDGVVESAVTGLGEGIVSGVGRFVNGATLGASDWLDRKTGGHLENLDNTLQERAESVGLGLANQVAKFGTEMTGNMAGAGGALVKGLNKAGLKGLKLAGTAGGIEGLAYGATSSDNLSDLPENMLLGGTLGAGLGTSLAGLGQGVKMLTKPFSSSLMTAGMQGGLDNVSGNPFATNILKQSLKNNKDVAEKYLQNVLPAKQNINANTVGMVDNALTSRINVPETIATERAKYADFMAKHGADEVLDFTPTRQQLVNYPAQSSFNPNTYSKAKAEAVLQDRAKQSGIKIGGELGHFSKRPDRIKTVRTLSNSLENPDIVYNKGNNEYVIKKYDTNNKPFFDFVTKKDGKLWTKFPVDANYVSNQINNSAQNVSLSGKITRVQPGLIHSLPQVTDSNISLQSVVVNPELPNVSTLYEGLTPFQSGQLDKALKTGLSKTNQKAGSLESLNKAKQEINKMISNAKVTDKPSEVWQLQELKNKFDTAMPESLKTADKGFARAKRLEDAFDKGTHYNPNNVIGADMITGLPADEQNAFAQGLFKRINNNSLSGKDLAKDALKYESTLAQVLPQEPYNRLIQGLNRQSTSFGRLSELGNVAESRLQRPKRTRFLGREQSKNKDMIRGMADWLNNLFRGRALRQAGMNLLNPDFTGWSPAGEHQLTNGLTASVLDNLTQKQLLENK